MFGKWTSNKEHVSGYDNSPPSQQLYQPQPPAFGYEVSASANVENVETTCEYFNAF